MRINENWTQSETPRRNALRSWSRSYDIHGATICGEVHEYQLSGDARYQAFAVTADSGRTTAERLGTASSFTGAVRLCDRYAERRRAIREDALTDRKPWEDRQREDGHLNDNSD